MVRLAQRYIDEGMQLDRYPGVAFRDGPAGRRAVVIGGPDVWEVIVAARDATVRGERLIAVLAERIGVAPEKTGTAIRYYAEYPDDVDRFTRSSKRKPIDSSGRSNANATSWGEAAASTRCIRRHSPSILVASRERSDGLSWHWTQR